MEHNAEEERSFLYHRGLWSTHRALRIEGVISGLTTRDVDLSRGRGRKSC